MSIVIGCDSFLALRNVRNGNLGQHLRDKGLVVLVDPSQYDGSHNAAPPGVAIRSLLEFNAGKDPRLAPLMNRAYVARKSFYDPATMWEKFRTSSHKYHQNNMLRRAVSVARARMQFYRYRLAGFMGKAQPWRQDFATALQAHPIMDEYCRLLKELDAEVVVAFSLEGPREMALIEAARKMGLPTAVMIRSRDNLAAKIQHLPDADAYCVWAETTRNMLLRLYPELPAERIHITGSPQFDHHLNPAYRLTREEFFRRIGLDPARPLVVYTCATPELVQHEINITQHLADVVRQGRLANNAQLLVRGHPRSFGSNYPLLRQTYPGVAVYPPPCNHPYKSAEHEAVVVQLILEDEPMHLATLAYQDVQVNISGTMIVDSAIFDKPTVGVYYDIPSNVLAGLSVRRFYKRSDMQPILASGGVRLAHSPDECVAWINRYLENPALDADGRRRIREQEVGPLDGRAGERMAALFRQLSERG
ncbi:MAG: hypothetical protein HZC41_08285 [Chloroflexi bacterium]|nr:hypothetical protein [Chloroflexota bacterium]